MASQAPLPFFGRAWNIAVDTADGQHLVVASSRADESLRATFAIDMYMLLAYWQAEVSIFNMSSQTAGTIWKGSPKLGDLWQFQKPLVAGDTVTVSAGYESSEAGGFNPDANVLYQGKVLQPVWLRENVVDYRLILRCVTGLIEDAVNFTSFPIAGGVSAHDALAQICSQANPPIPIDRIDEGARTRLSQQSYPRAQAIHGRPWNAIRSITAENNLFAWVNPRGLNVRSFGSGGTPQTPDYAYGPPEPAGNSGSRQTAQGLVKRTLIGTPEQTQDGVVFRVLLDPQVRIGDIVLLEPGTLINPVPIQVGQLPAAPSQNGIYVVAGLRHFGDTRGRGDDWFTEIHGVVMDFFANFLTARQAGQ